MTTKSVRYSIAFLIAAGLVRVVSGNGRRAPKAEPLILQSKEGSVDELSANDD